MYSNVQACLRKYGYGLVNRVMCGDDAPLFQLDTGQSFSILSLRKFIKQLPEIGKQLEKTVTGKTLYFCTTPPKFLIKHPPPPAKLKDCSGLEDVHCEVMTQLYLICPETTKKDVDIFLVKENSVLLCFDLWQKSSIFDFDHDFRMKIKDSISVASGTLQD